MKDPSRTNQELLEEISILKQKIKGREHSESERKQAEEALQRSVKADLMVMFNCRSNNYDMREPFRMGLGQRIHG